MINSQDDEFVAVRVQDPRIQNEGSWNSYVDYKIFLHTNSKAFTAKTSCVRRRYSEFVWLKKKLQKNAGLVPVPDLPGKSFFSFSNEDFLEGRRKGLQSFLDKVVHMTVCLSDSQLHLFLQTQLPIGHIQDCVQGHTPYSVTDAILTYASSNRGYAQAQEEDSIKERSLTVSYESMESPAPHQPTTQATETFSPELVSCSDSDPLEGLLQPCEKDTIELQHKEKSSIKVLQKNNHLEAVVEDCSPTEASFFVGDSQEEAESPSHVQQRSCRIQTPVEVHSPMETGFEVSGGTDGMAEEVGTVREESVTTSDTEEKTVAHPDTEDKAEELESSEEANVEDNVEPEKCVNSVAILDFKDTEAESEEDVLEDVCSEKQVLENHLISEVNGLEHSDAEGHDGDVSDHQEFSSSVEQEEPENEGSADSSKEETLPESEVLEESHNEQSFTQVQSDGDDITHQTDQNQLPEQEVDLIGTKDDEDSRSLPSSNESIVKVSDEEEESICEEAEDSIQAENGYMKTPPEEVTLWSETSGGNILDLHMNGCPVTKEDVSTQEDEDLQDVSRISELSKSVDQNSTVTGGDLTENSDFSILESSCSPGLADSRCAE